MPFKVYMSEKRSLRPPTSKIGHIPISTLRICKLQECKSERFTNSAT